MSIPDPTSGSAFRLRYGNSPSSKVAPDPKSIELYKNHTDLKVQSVAGTIFKVLLNLTLLPIKMLIGIVAIVTMVGQALYSLAQKGTSKAALFGLTFFNRSLLENGLGIERFGVRYRDIDIVGRGVLVSRMPFKGDIDTFRQALEKAQKGLEEGVPVEALKASINKLDKDNSFPDSCAGFVIDLTEPGERTLVFGHGEPATKEDWAAKHIGYMNVKAEDLKPMDVEATENLAKVVEDLRKAGIPVLIHCAKGVGRSATVAAAAIAKYDHDNKGQPLNATEALNQLKANRAIGMNLKQELVIYKIKFFDALEQSVLSVSGRALQSLGRIEACTDPQEKSRLWKQFKEENSFPALTELSEALGRANTSFAKSFSAEERAKLKTILVRVRAAANGFEGPALEAEVARILESPARIEVDPLPFPDQLFD